MEITPFSGNVNVIQALSDRPNATDGLTAAQLKAKYDEAANLIKTYLNGTLIPELAAYEGANLHIFSALSYGAVGDGITDDTAALASAFASGNPICLPKGYTFRVTSELSLSSDYQYLFGGGKIVSTLTSGSVIKAENLTGVKVISIQIDAGDTADSSGVFFDGCINSYVEGCQISKFGEAGVKFTNCIDCKVLYNRFLDAASDATFGSPSSRDIDIYGDNSGCIVKGNICKSSGGYAVQIRTYNNGENNDRHIVSENIIDGYNSYGILLYRNAQVIGDVPQQSVTNCIVSKNVVMNISGARPSDPAQPSVLIFGAGIYLQGAEKCDVTDNELINTCTSTNNELLAPGAIGLSNVGECTVEGNSIYNSSRYGIYVNDSLDYGAVKGVLAVTGNTIDTCTKSGIRITVKNNVVINGNGITNCEYGIFTSGGSSNLTRNFYNIVANIIRACTATGMSLSYLSGVLVKGNTVEGAATHGISASNSSDVVMEGNKVKTITSRGLELGATCSGLNKVSGNQVSSCGTGILLNAPATFEDNTIESNTTNLSGSYIPFAALTDSTTPSVKYRRIVTVAPASATTITNFTDGLQGQVIHIQATNGNATIQHNSNIVLQGAANFTMASNNVLTLMKSATSWVEISRKT